jgi:cobalt-precorrin 5A hydrolase/precorrin-3B C17-methyltransferase
VSGAHGNPRAAPAPAPRVLSVSVTERGRRLALGLPYDHAHADAAETVRARWGEVDAFVLFLAVGAAVRIVAPLLGDKRSDPAVVCVDEAGRFAVALSGGHGGGRGGPGPGANSLARTVGALLGAEPVVTTATDAIGAPALDCIPGLTARGDLPGVTAALLDGRRPLLENPLRWPLPAGLADLLRVTGGAEAEGETGAAGPSEAAGQGPERVVVTDEDLPAPRGTAVLHPPSLVAGVGASRSAPADEARRLLEEALTAGGLARDSLSEVATIDQRREEPAVASLGLPVRSFAAEELRTVTVPTPSGVVEAAVGTPSVAEAAALLASGPGGRLVVNKRHTAHTTVAIARRRRPRGAVSVVGLGPGAPEHRTPAAEAAVRRADLVIGYEAYVDRCADLVGPGQEVAPYPIGEEAGRARRAVSEASRGRQVALVCSGDPGIYAMAALCLETWERGVGRSPADLSQEAPDDIDIRVVPGVSAALASSAALGAPLGHDHAVVSLSDLLTPWEVIEGRLHAIGASGMAVALYNPRSRRRRWQLRAALDLLAGYRGSSTPVGVVTDATKPSERVEVTTIAELDCGSVGMSSCVIVGSDTTRSIRGRLFTPRGYPT